MPSTPELEALKANFSQKVDAETANIQAAEAQKHDAQTRQACWLQSKDAVQAKIDAP